MTSLSSIDARLDALVPAPERAHEDAERLLRMGEEVLEYWLEANGKAPANATREGFRLLALHAQGARGDPNFNACRETCRETAYWYNVAMGTRDPAELARAIATLKRLVQHLNLFISGKCQSARLGEFCCSARPLRQQDGETL